MNRRLFLGALAAPLLPNSAIDRIRRSPRTGDAITARDFPGSRIVVDSVLDVGLVDYTLTLDGKDQHRTVWLKHWRENKAWATAEVA